MPFEAVQQRIADYLVERAQRTAIAQFVARLAARAAVIGVELPTPADLQRQLKEALMLLGTAIARLQDDAYVEETLAALDDWVLIARLRGAADAAGLSLSDFASAAVGSFLDRASDEDWLALMTAANGAADPASACLKVMVAFGVKPEATARATPSRGPGR